MNCVCLLTTLGKKGGKMQSESDDVIVMAASDPRNTSCRQLNLGRLFCAASSWSLSAKQKSSISRSKIVSTL